MKRLFVISILLLLAATVSADEQATDGKAGDDQQIYTWVDKEGVTHYANSAEEAAKQAEVNNVELDQEGSLSVIPDDTRPSQAPTQDASGESDNAQN